MADGVVSVSFGRNGETRKFKSQDDLVFYIRSNEFLGWLDILGPSTEFGNIDHLRSRVTGEIINNLSNYTWPHNTSGIEGIMNQFPLPTRGMPLAKAIEVLAKGDVDHAARVLLSAADVAPQYTPKMGKAAAELLLIEKGMSKTTTETTLLAMNALSQEFRERIDGAKLAAEEHAEIHKALMEGHVEEFRQALAANIQSTMDETSKALAQVTKSLEDLENVKKGYIEHMALDASVKYWRDKATRHQDILTKGRLPLEWRVPSYFVLAAGAVASYLIFFAIPHVDKDQPEKTVLYATLGIFVTSLILWYGRLLTRQLISHRNLLEDAEERVVMIKSYIAMTKEGHVAKEDRVLALGAAFRSAGSGHPSDDGSTDISTAAIIGRLVQNDKP